MPQHDLDDILNRIDLEALADQLCGPHRGHGSGARWPSPVPDHPQTGKTPTMDMLGHRHFGHRHRPRHGEPSDERRRRDPLAR
jgi:hypothetical protein